MGVIGLLPLLKSIQRQEKLAKYAGQTLGIDGYVWLHRGAHGCAIELAQGKETRRYVYYAVQRIRMLRHFGVHPYFVFDGDYLPSKAMTEDGRAKRREASRKAALELLAAGKSAQALQDCQKCVDVTPEMARELITELQRLNVPYLVAPYEADAQLVYLERQGIIDGIISEDSDLLVFGAKKLLTKLDKYGELVEINRRDFAACREVSLAGWTDTNFRHMAIFSGCDYLKGLPGVGLKKAHSMLRKWKTPDNVLRMVQLEGKIRVPDHFLANFLQAELTFLHQRVYCPTKNELVFLTEPEPGKGIEELPFLGAPVEPELARAVAKGDVNPITKLPIKPLKTPDSVKRRHSQFSGLHGGTGVAQSVGASASVSAARRPPVRPIESYFGGHRRVPMGEMDPNCFSVDKQRLATITNSGLAPIVYPLPRPYLDEAPAQSSNPPAAPRVQRRRTEPISSLLASLESAPTRFSSIPNSSAAASSSRPPKKARLCQDTDEDAPRPSKSKFFSLPPSARPSPPRRRSEGFLMPDQSLDEALFDLPDVDGWNVGSKHRPLGVFQDKKEVFSVFSEEIAVGEGMAVQESVRETDPEVPEDPEVKITEDPEVSGDPKASEAADAAKSSGMPAPPLPQQIKAPASPQARSSLSSTIRNYSYTPNTQTSTRRTSHFLTPSSNLSRAPSLFTPAMSSPSTPATNMSTAAPTRRLTPLERIGARALHRNSLSPIKQQPLVPAKLAALKPRHPFATNPSFVPLPKVDIDEVEALNRPCGSEDLIIPASDDDDGENEGIITARTLDLSRFAFA